ncbi:MAG: hypothetical protein ONB46_18615 [candidate division KSB1 bacterium]|nr:hypothetical protein [candidate division KSB1 bacterium]MDZ7367894.1 hypothetical protein [candidate division KSB1 bacterium]
MKISVCRVAFRRSTFAEGSTPKGETTSYFHKNIRREDGKDISATFQKACNLVSSVGTGQAKTIIQVAGLSTTLHFEPEIEGKRAVWDLGEELPLVWVHAHHDENVAQTSCLHAAGSLRYGIFVVMTHARARHPIMMKINVCRVAFRRLTFVGSPTPQGATTNLFSEETFVVSPSGVQLLSGARRLKAKRQTYFQRKRLSCRLQAFNFCREPDASRRNDELIFRGNVCSFLVFGFAQRGQAATKKIYSLTEKELSPK